MTNYYPTLPMLKYEPTPISMGLAVATIKALGKPLEVKKSTYIIFRNESANGSKGINNNFGGIQTDSGRWPPEYDKYIIGNVQIKENKTGKMRLFAAFESPFTFFEMLSDRLEKRGIYVGGDTHHVVKVHVDTPQELALIYKREWVTGDPDAELKGKDLTNFLSMYNQASKLFV